MRSCSRRLWALWEEEGGGSNLRSIATTTSFLRFRSFFGIFLRHVYFCTLFVPTRGGHAAKNRLAEGIYEGVLVARVGVRDKVGPQCVTERSTHVLGDAPEQPAPALLCALSVRLRPILHSLTGWAGW
jgi:hypothetical protein